jgi:sirohydrochlorin cobaltochelatase
VGEADVALILAVHGSKRTGALSAIYTHAAELSRRGPFREVLVLALFGGGPKPADVLRRLRAPRAVVVPLMMCDGQTAREALPRALATAGDGTGRAARSLTFTPAIGEHPALAPLIAARAAAAAAERCWPPTATTLLLIGHGSSRNPASFHATTGQAQRVRRLTAFARVETAFLEQSPLLDEALANLTGPVVAVGLFAGAGMHAAADVAQAILRSGRGDVHYAGPIGNDANLVDVVLAVAGERAQATL